MWLSFVCLRFCSYMLLVRNHLLVTLWRCSKCFQKHYHSPLESFCNHNQDILEDWVTMPLLEMGMGTRKSGLASISTEQILVKCRHNRVSGACVSETGVPEWSFCLWNLARPMGEAPEESWERRVKVSVYERKLGGFPPCNILTLTGQHPLPPELPVWK